MTSKKSILALTPGDPAGIGPEVTWKAIQTQNPSASILCVGARAPFEALGAPIIEVSADRSHLEPPHSDSPFVWLLPAPTHAPAGTLLEGYQSGWAIQKATELVLQKKAAALVTGPISKDRLQKGGFQYSGHTEFLADLCGVKSVTMMLANDRLRIALVTTHIGIQQVSSALTREKLRRAVLQTAEGLTRLWGITRPRIAVAALNPHAGESGLFGREEIDLIEPEIQALARSYGRKMEVLGPFPADTLFAKHLLAQADQRPEQRQNQCYDAIICMYHDQGLIPVKLLDFYKTVNITLGLPIVRTSVDHGVAFDIAGKGIANPSSLCAALDLAARTAI